MQVFCVVGGLISALLLVEPLQGQPPKPESFRSRYVGLDLSVDFAAIRLSIIFGSAVEARRIGG